MSTIISTEQSNPHSCNIDLLNGLEIARLINQEDFKVAPAIQQVLPEIGQAIELIAASLRQNGRMAYFGAGTSGRIGILDASECPPTYNTAPHQIQAFIAGGEEALCHSVENAEDRADLALQDLQKFDPEPQDIIVAISASGNPAYVVEILQQAQRLGCKTIAVTTNCQAAFKPFSDIFICPQVGPEVVTGSSRMKSGTAQKMVLNMLTTGAMIRLGKTFHNYMVDVRVSNEKLHQRAVRIVSEISNVSEAEAKKFLALAENNVKIATVMASKNCSAAIAQQLLSQNHNIIRRIIEE